MCNQHNPEVVFNPVENMLQKNLKEIFEKFDTNSLFIGAAESDGVRYSEVNALAVMHEFALVKRKLVFCLMENHIGGLSGYLALLTAGAVPLMLSSTILQPQLRTLLEAYNPGYVWLPSSRVVEFTDAELVFNYRDYSLISLQNTTYPIHNSLALLLSTSGSTGSPKFVRLSQENVLSNARSIAQYLKLGEMEVPITTLPPNYSYGLSIIHSHLFVGATIAVTNKTFFDREFWNFLREVNATSFGGVPYHYEMLKKLRFTRMELPSLRTITQAGGRMEPDLTKEYAVHCTNKGMDFVSMYGQTEATARMAYLPSEKSIDKSGSIGFAIPGGRFWLEDDSGCVIETSETPGELVYEGANVCMGYADGCEDLDKGDEMQGRLRTGDIAIRDTEGDYRIVGRLKRFIKIFGNRINLQEVENFLQDAGYQAVCTGGDDRLEIYLLDSVAGDAVPIKKQVVEFLQIAVSGVVIYGVSNIPRSESGKIQYSELKPHIGIQLT